MKYFLTSLPIAFISMLVIATACSVLQDYPQDNVVEEIVEEIILAECGVDIDLSPFTPEKK